jgi:hypothetical protein
MPLVFSLCSYSCLTSLGVRSHAIQVFSPSSEPIPRFQTLLRGAKPQLSRIPEENKSWQPIILTVACPCLIKAHITCLDDAV